MKKAEMVVIEKSQWENIKNIAWQLDEQVEKLNWDPLESCPTILKTSDLSNSLWKEINKIENNK